jgi:hypothetical protein
MEDCSICLEKICKDDSQENSEVILDCSHKYHLDCIYINITKGVTPKKCPLCREIINPNKIIFNLDKNNNTEQKKKEHIINVLNNYSTIDICGNRLNIIPYPFRFARSPINNDIFWRNLSDFSIDVWDNL